MGHDGHVHSGSAKRDLVATIAVIGLAALELAVGGQLSNPAIVADGGHGMVDAIGTIVSAIMKRMINDGSSHRVQVHVPARIGIGICMGTVVLIGWFAISQALSQTPITVLTACTAIALGAGGCILRVMLARYIRKGGSPTDVANAQHFRSDADTSAMLLACGTFALAWDEYYTNGGSAVPDWAFRIGALAIMAKVLIDNWHAIQRIRRDLRQCDCNGQSTE